MRRESPFPLSVDRWQRADWLLLQHSAVHRAGDAAELQQAEAQLTGLGWLVHVLDAGGCATVDDLHAVLAAGLSFPGHYGRNLAALNDVLSDIAGYEYGSDPATTGTAVLIHGYDSVVGIDPVFAHWVLDVFAGQARCAALLGHPMLCIVASTARFPNVGATSVPGPPLLLPPPSEADPA